MPAPAYSPFRQSPLPAALTPSPRRSCALAGRGSSLAAAARASSDGVRALARIARREASVSSKEGAARAALAAASGGVMLMTAGSSGAAAAGAGSGAGRGGISRKVTRSGGVSPAGRAGPVSALCQRHRSA